MATFRKIGILSSGGDAPGMNAAIRAVTRRAISQGIEVVGILGGYAGLIGAADESNPEIIREKYLRPLDTRSVSNIVTRGGTILYSSRCPEFKTEEGMQKALKVCHEQQIDAVVAIGGDGTFRGATDLTNHGIPSIGIPGTIDNDITATDQTIGFDTALNTACRMIDDLRDTAESHARCIIAEVMGNGCGYLTLYTGIATGAIFMAIPEIPFDKEYAISKVHEARSAYGKRGIIALCCEGMPKVGEFDYGKALAAEIQERTGVDSRFNRLGHIIRGGNPTLRDRVTATQMGVEAVNRLLDGESNLVMCVRENRITSVDINFALALDKMYKNKLKDGDLEGFTNEQIAKMQQRCEYRHTKIERLYNMCHDISM
jgi:6-phosphofructokinase 1